MQQVSWTAERHSPEKIDGMNLKLSGETVYQGEAMTLNRECHGRLPWGAWIRRFGPGYVLWEYRPYCTFSVTTSL